jgi:hypothetical protein
MANPFTPSLKLSFNHVMVEVVSYKPQRFNSILHSSIYISILLIICHLGIKTETRRGERADTAVTSLIAENDPARGREKGIGEKAPTPEGGDMKMKPARRIDHHAATGQKGRNQREREVGVRSENEMRR